jgi:hypothetical protein
MLQWQQQPLHDDNTVAIVVCVGCGSHPVLLSEVGAHSIKREIKHVPNTSMLSILDFLEENAEFVCAPEEINKVTDMLAHSVLVK